MSTGEVAREIREELEARALGAIWDVIDDGGFRFDVSAEDDSDGPGRFAVIDRETGGRYWVDININVEGLS